MIIQLQGTTTDTAAGRRTLQAMISSWGHEITEAPVQPTAPAGTARDNDGKGLDPVAVASLVLSIPSAALAAADLADRIRKRRRAQELIDHARQLAARQVTITLITPARATELSALTPDQLLDLLAEEPAS
jgi:hypothetical protein